MIGSSPASSLPLTRRVSVAGLLAMALTPVPAAAQVIRGKVVEFRSDFPVADAQIRLLDGKKNELEVGTRTDSVGDFILRVPGPGRYIVRARRLGYDEFLSIPKDVKETDTVRVNLWPEANGQLLDSILSLGLPVKNSRTGTFAARQREGHGSFITREKIQKEGYRDLEQALSYSLSGLEIRHRGLQSTGICYRTCCNFTIYHNGLPTITPSNARSISMQIDGALATRARNLYGVEVYIGRNEIPMEYRDGSKGFCGLISYWTHTPD